MGLTLKITGKTDQGRKRSKNEDTFLVDNDLMLMIVADGMGGHASGEVASQLATQLCAEQLKRSLQTGHVPVFHHVPRKTDLDPRTLTLGDCVKFSNEAVYEAAQANPANHNMGTTLVAALWLDDKLAIAHVGDSRLYLVRDGKLLQITVDHSYVQEQIDLGFIKREDAEKSNMRNMLTRSVGVSDNVDVDMKEIALKQGDYILLCSDGLTKMLDDDQILTIFKKHQDPQQLVDELINGANNAGGGDNVTVIIGLAEETSAFRSFADRLVGIFKKKVERN
jgi:protein phosphatase